MSKVLATDLDGTLIPLSNKPENEPDLDTLRAELEAKQVTLTFVTGRHLESVQEAITQHRLPLPAWIICDVGTSVYRSDESGSIELATAYVEHLRSLIGDFPTSRVHELFAEETDLRKQEEEKQGEFKLSYYCDANQLRKIINLVRDTITRHEAPYHVIGSVDPFNGDGLIDLLPTDVSKAYALQWWTEHAGMDNSELVFSGDSGNDLAAMTAGYRTIVVGNAALDLIETVRAHYDHEPALLYVAEKPATSGVLAGCRHFGLI
ncbi:HAD-IIB family hydrolase [Bremerella cremea]|uniref:HAD-IIB family hydrolase n=1 Tax=Bremerella cremea TaxID=1031537 RepID=UPI0031E72C82